MAKEKIISLEPTPVQVKSVEIENTEFGKKAMVIFDDADGTEQRVHLRSSKFFYVDSELVKFDSIEDCVDEFKERSKTDKFFIKIFDRSDKFARFMWTGANTEERPRLLEQSANRYSISKFAWQH